MSRQMEDEGVVEAIRAEVVEKYTVVIRTALFAYDSTQVSGYVALPVRGVTESANYAAITAVAAEVINLRVYICAKPQR